MSCAHCGDDDCTNCSCDDWDRVYRYKPIIESCEQAIFSPLLNNMDLTEFVDKLNSGEIKPKETEILITCDYYAVEVCEGCGKEQEIVRQGEHFQDDLDILLITLGNLMHKLDPLEERLIE